MKSCFLLHSKFITICISWFCCIISVFFFFVICVQVQEHVSSFIIKQKISIKITSHTMSMKGRINDHRTNGTQEKYEAKLVWIHQNLQILTTTTTMLIMSSFCCCCRFCSFVKGQHQQAFSQ